jgi:hypothetical protein
VTDPSEGASRHKKLKAALLEKVAFEDNQAKLDEVGQAVEACGARAEALLLADIISYAAAEVTDPSEGASRYKRLETALLKLVSFASISSNISGGVLRDES